MTSLNVRVSMSALKNMGLKAACVLCPPPIPPSSRPPPGSVVEFIGSRSLGSRTGPFSILLCRVCDAHLAPPPEDAWATHAYISYIFIIYIYHIYISYMYIIYIYKCMYSYTYIQATGQHAAKSHMRMRSVAHMNMSCHTHVLGILQV